MSPTGDIKTEEVMRYISKFKYASNNFECFFYDFTLTILYTVYNTHAVKWISFFALKMRVIRRNIRYIPVAVLPGIFPWIAKSIYDIVDNQELKI